MRNSSATVVILSVAPLLGCASDGSILNSKAKKGAVAGTVAGAIAGAVIGGHEHRAGGALIGAAVGGLTGGVVGRYLDQQARDLDAIPGAVVQRRDDSLLVNFSSSLLFDTGSSRLQPGGYDRLRSLARTLNNYPKSQVIIKGHTDSVGEESYNQHLSEERADRVRSFLISESVSVARITAIGFGQSLPVASNTTPTGRAQNRRVVVEIRPNREVLAGGGFSSS